VTPPVPPPDLASRRLPLRTIVAETALWRIHDDRRDPVWFGPAPDAGARNRFDAPAGEFRICYFGLSLEAAFAETFLRNPGRKIVDRTLLGSRALTVLRNRRALSVVRLHGPGLARAGATAEVTHGPDYGLARAWSLALWSHPSRPDGILYSSRHDDDEICLAVFDRASDAIHPERSERLLSSPSLPRLLLRYRVSFDPRG
jgi:hypothetical protein